MLLREIVTQGHRPRPSIYRALHCYILPRVQRALKVVCVQRKQML